MRALIISALFVLATSFRAADNADAIVGVWKNGTGKGHIQIFKQQGKFYGKIIWLRDAIDPRTGRPKTDFKNEDASQHNNPLIGLVMLRDFRFDDGEWNGGRIYNPGDGKEYKAYIKMKDFETLLVRGYIGFSMLGKTDTWTRVR